MSVPQTPQVPTNVVRLVLSYELPVACGDEQNERRRTHADLPDLDDAGLEAEAERVKLTLAFGRLGPHGPWAREWLYERLRSCRSEYARRKAARR